MAARPQTLAADPDPSSSNAWKGCGRIVRVALIREASDPNIDLVILASQDTDLEPALDEALSLGTAKVETASWYDNVDRRASKDTAA